MPVALRLFLYGLCMGTADVIPGISGGTVAFIMGFYDQLISSVKNPIKGWRFLLPLGCGMGTAILFLAEIIHTILLNPSQRTCFYGLFFGLILASIYFCAQRIQRLTLNCLLGALVMTVPAYILTVGLQVQTEQVLSTYWLFFTGFVAIGAMLLPGVSGSYVMVIFGVYPSVMRSIAEIGTNGPSTEPVLLLATVGLGIIAGALCFTRGIELLLRHYQDLTMACLIGFMIGALPAVWPFSSNVPGIDLVSIIALCFMGIGFYMVLF